MKEDRKSKIDKILANTKFSMEMEGYEIDEELEAVGRKLLTGEVKREDYIEQLKQQARKIADG